MASKVQSQSQSPSKSRKRARVGSLSNTTPTRSKEDEDWKEEDDEEPNLDDIEDPFESEAKPSTSSKLATSINKTNKASRSSQTKPVEVVVNEEEVVEEYEVLIDYYSSEEEQYEEEESFEETIKSNNLKLNHECDTIKSLDDIRPSEHHTILFDFNSLKCSDHTGPPLPLSGNTFVDHSWDDENFVRLPFSDNNVFRGSKHRKWKEITRCLSLLKETLVKDPDSQHIENAIKAYNPEKKAFNFDVLHYLFSEELEGARGEELLSDLLPRMIRLALSLPKKLTKAVPLLTAGKSHSVSLSQEQCACILANAFFCTFPDTDNPLMPYINFLYIFSRSKHEKLNKTRKVEKLKCLLHYFRRVTNSMPEGVVTFTRQAISFDHIPTFSDSTKPIRTAIVRRSGTIEDCEGALQLDFANKYLGGGVLGHGCVQEEIRFLICPELLVSMLLFERLEANEAAIMKGVERFSSYKGYASSFEWSDDYQDFTPKDVFRRMYTHIVAIDALDFKKPMVQFQEGKVQRELRKAYVGFYQSHREAKNCNDGGAAAIAATSSTKQPLQTKISSFFGVNSKSVVQMPTLSTSQNSKDTNNNVSSVAKTVIATGNWGCGAFNGNKQLKFLIQLMAAAEADRDLVFFTFHEEKTRLALCALMQVIREQRLTVGHVYKLVNEYSLIVSTLKEADVDKYDLSTFFVRKFQKDE